MYVLVNPSWWHLLALAQTFCSKRDDASEGVALWRGLPTNPLPTEV